MFPAQSDHDQSPAGKPGGNPTQGLQKQIEIDWTGTPA
ncbi:hypothetical protein HDA40_000726 [Hamadaea flava]|nr:hypothetical protein [Hamadaea flava]